MTYTEDEFVQTLMARHGVREVALPADEIHLVGCPAKDGGDPDLCDCTPRPEMIVMVMDESDWNFVIDCLRHRARREPTTSDTADRANFTADTMQDVLDGAR